MGKEKDGPQSDFMFLVLCNEAFGYTHLQTLDSSMSVIMAMLKEHGYLINERNKLMNPTEEDDSDGEYVYLYDFDTGQKKRVKKMNRT